MTDVEECLLRGILEQLVELQGNLGEGIASSFLDLTDTPSAYTGQAGKVILVNPGETGLAFATLAGGVSDGDKGDVTVSSSGAAWTLNDLLTPALGATPSSSRLALRNLTAATSGNQQASGAFELEGQGFATTPGASRSVKWRMWNQPVQGTTNPTTNLLLQSSVNGGAWATVGTLTNEGLAIASQPWNGIALSLYGAGGSTCKIGVGATGIIQLPPLGAVATAPYPGVVGIGLCDTINSSPGTHLVRRSGLNNWVGIGLPSATPTTQTANGQDGSGTNISGGTLRLMAGRGTGSGNSGNVEQATSLPGSSGTITHTSITTRSSVAGKHTSLVDSTETDFATINLQTGKVCGGKIVVTVMATDGTDHQARTYEILFQAVNKAGTTTVVLDTVAGSLAASAGTLSVTFDTTTTGTSFTLRANAASSLAATLSISWAAVNINSNDALTISAV